jgi:GH43 family beta-xylosidase
VWDVEMGEVGGYRLSWEIHGTHMRHRTGTSAGLRDLQRIEDASSPAAGDAAPPATATPIPAEQIPPTPIASASPPFANAILGNTLELTDAEVERLERTLLPVTNTGVEVADLSVVRKSEVQLEELPQAVCTYSDGSTHAKSVDWDHAALAAVDTDRPGTYEVPGRVRVRRDLFPFIDEFMSDPSICRIGDRFFLSSSRENAVSFRIAESIEGLRDAEWIDVLPVTNPSGGPANIWAQEMHVIQGVPYVFTTVGPEGWTSVQSVVVRCTGDPADPSAWDQPRPVVRPDGEVLAGKDGISLDMTWFEEGGRHYVMWSGRDFVDRTPGAEIADSADMLIATIDPAAPWQLTSEPVRFLRPMYGWDRCQTPVDEGPYLLRHGEDLFVTIAGSSTGLPDLYCVGLLRARSGSNLLDPSAWDWCPYPVLTKESVPGQFGPGHNAFLVDPETGDDLLIFHAVPHDAEGVALGRHMGIRRVHWDVNGLPDLRLTPERDLPVEREHVMCTVRVR